MKSSRIPLGRTLSTTCIFGLLAFVAGCSDNNGSSEQPDYRMQAEMIQLVAHLNTLRVLAAEYHFNEGKLPESLTDLGIDENRLQIEKAESVRFSHGQIVATGTAYKGWLSLTPTPVGDGSRLEWNCATNVKGMITPAFECHYSETVPAHP